MERKRQGGIELVVAAFVLAGGLYVGQKRWGAERAMEVSGKGVEGANMIVGGIFQ